MICINGKQIKPPGQSGIYFICQHGRYKGNHCRWARWCKESHSYISATDKYGNVCPDFSTTEIAEEQKTIDNNPELGKQAKTSKVEDLSPAAQRLSQLIGGNRKLSGTKK